MLLKLTRREGQEGRMNTKKTFPILSKYPDENKRLREDKGKHTRVSVLKKRGRGKKIFTADVVLLTIRKGEPGSWRGQLLDYSSNRRVKETLPTGK